MDYLFMLIYSIIIKSRIQLHISMPNYNLKTRYTVIPSYDVGIIPKLIFFDTAQRYILLFIVLCMYVMCLDVTRF